MPITKTSGVNTGKLRLFGSERLKIKLHYKIICDFCRGRQIVHVKKYNDNNNLEMYSGMVIAKNFDGQLWCGGAGSGGPILSSLQDQSTKA